MAGGADSEINIVTKLTADFADYQAKFQALGQTTATNMAQAEAAVKKASDKMKADLDSVASHAHKSGQNVATSFLQGFELVVAGAAFGFLMSLTDHINEAVQAAHELSILGVVTGETLPNLQKLEYAMAGVGISADKAQMTFRMFERNIATQAEQSGKGKTMLERMGFDPKAMQVMGQTAGGFTKNFEMVIEKMGKLDAASRAEAGQKIFGLRWAELSLLMGKSAKEIDAAGNAIYRAGGGMSDDTIEKMDRLNASFQRLGMTLKAFYASFVAPFVDGMTTLITKFQELLAWFEKLSAQSKMGVAISALTVAFLSMETAMALLSKAFMGVQMRAFLTGIMRVGLAVQVVVVLITALWFAWQSNFGNIRGLTEQLIPILIDAFERVKQILTDVWNEVKGPLQAAWTELSASLARIGQDFMRLVTWLSDQKWLWGLLRDKIEEYAKSVLFLIQVVVAIISALSHWRDILINIELWLGKAFDAASKFADSMATIISHVPGLELVAGAVKLIAGRWQEAADAHNKYAGSLMVSPHSGAPFADILDPANKKKEVEKKKPMGPEHLGPVPAKAGHVKAEAPGIIAALKATMEPFQDAIKDTEFAIALVKEDVVKLGDLDSPQKLAAKQQLVNKEYLLTKQEIDRIQHAAEQAGRVIDSLAKLAKKSHDPVQVREYESAIRSMRATEYSLMLKRTQDETKLFTLSRGMLKDKEAFYAKEAADINNSYALRMKYLEADLAITKNAKDRLDLEGKIATLKIEQLKNQEKFSVLASEQRIKEAEHAKDTKGDDPIKPLKQQAEKLRQALLDVTIATEKKKQKDDEYEAAKRDLEATNQADTKGRHEAEVKVAEALYAHIQSEWAVTDANKEVARLKREESVTVLGLRGEFDKLARSVAGPLMNAIDMVVKQGMNPLQAAFFALVSQSKSFHDVTVILQKVFAAIAQILDAARPVIDFLLGVIVGVVDVFLSLYNIIASILNVFGAHIEKIKMVNATLDDMNKSGQVTAPLLQIGHDLPTANEYNAGKWGPLIANAQTQAANNIQNTLNEGFNHGIAKMGEIIGVLLAIKAILFAKATMEAFSGSGSFLSKIGKLFGHHGGGSSGSSSSGGTGLGDGGMGGDSPFGGAGDGGESSTPGPGMLSEITTSNAVTADAASRSASSIQENTLTQGKQGAVRTKSMSSAATKISYAMDAFTIATVLFGSKAGQTAAEIKKGNEKVGAAVGNAIGTFFGGPVGGAIGGAVGGFFGGLFGPKHSGSQPDLTDPNFGNEQVGLTGGPFSTQGFGAGKMDDQIKQMTGGAGLLAYIQQAIAKGKAGGLTDAEKAEFGSTGGGLKYDKNIENESVVGGSFHGNYQQLWQDAVAAAQKIHDSIGDAAKNVNDVMAGATSVDMAKIFGNGTVSAMNGGYSLNPGGNNQALSVAINIENVHGTDPAAIKAAFTPIMDHIATTIGRQQMTIARTQGSSYGRDNF